MKNKSNQPATTLAMRIVFSAAAIALAGCATPYNGFGQSVRNMVAQQTMDPLASSVDPEKSIKPIDGAKAARVMEVHRENIAKPENVDDDIIINIGK